MKKFSISACFLFIIFYWSESHASGRYHGDGYLVEDHHYKSTKEPAYYNPFGYDTCRKGKFRFDWMRDESSFFCPLSQVAVERHGYQHHKVGKPRIVQGFEAELGEFPSYVQLIMAVDSMNASACGGTLLNEYLILTAAHCIMNRIGGSAFAGSTQFSSDQKRAIKRACLPREYEDPVKEPTPHDWAILEVKGQFSLTREVQPACVNFDYRLKSDIKCVGVGFGQTESSTDLSRSLKAAVVKQYKPFVDQEAAFIWTSKFEGQSGAGKFCYGDSGGPLYCFENCSGEPKMYVVGVTSTIMYDEKNGTQCSDNKAGIFVNTVSLRKLVPPLIKQMMARREKRTIHRLVGSQAEEIDPTAMDSEQIQCVDFNEVNSP